MARWTKTMRWMLDDRNALVVIFGGDAVGAVFYVIPFGVRAGGFALFEREPNE